MRLRVFLLSFLLLLLGLIGCSKNEIVITNNHNANYAIYCDSTEHLTVKHAAHDLAKYLEKISGVKYKIISNETSEQKLIIIGRKNSYFKNANFPIKSNSIKNDGFYLYSDEHDRIYIFGNIDRGTMYGVYYFLDHYLGVRWFAADFEVVPKNKKITIPTLADLQNPRFAYREIFSGDTDDPYFRVHNLLNGNRWDTHRTQFKYPPEVNAWSEDGPAGGHNFHDIISEKYHYGGQILAMNENVRREAMDYFVRLVARQGAKHWYAFSQEDNGWQPDPESKAFADAHGGVLSAPIVDLVSDVAARVRKIYPEAHLSTDAYQWSFLPPIGLTVPEYVLVEIAPIEENFAFPYNDTLHNRRAFKAFNGWNRIAKTLGVWDYITNFQNYLQPWPNIYPMCENIRYFAGLKAIRSYFAEGGYNTKGAEFATLRAWVAARLLWNPDLDYHRLIDEYCTGYYGPAAEYIKQYINALHESAQKCNTVLSSKQPIASDYLNLKFIKTADSLMALADSIAKEPFSKHVHNVRLGIDMTILLRKHFYKAQAGKAGMEWKDDPQRLERFMKYAKEANISDYSEDQNITALYEALKINRIFPATPPIVSSNASWLDFQDMDFQICCGASLVQDEKASDHGAAKYHGKEWAIQMKLDMLPPGAKWLLYAAVKVETKPHVPSDAIAFNMGIFPGNHKNIKVSQIKKGEYQYFLFPDMPIVYQTGKEVWFTTGPGAKNLYVDRIIAIQKNENLH